jgi:hypothetical protein
MRKCRGSSWSMDKRILTLGCICAVAILLGVSFSSVVGHSSNKSNFVKVSPLYSIRTNKAIENGEDVTTCVYVGKGRQSKISIPVIDVNRAILIDKFRGMDDNAFSKFIALAIINANNNYQIKNIGIFNIIKMFYQLREKSEVLNYADIVYKSENFPCKFLELISIIIIFILQYIFYTEVPYTCNTQCGTFCPTCDLETYCQCIN